MTKELHYSKYGWRNICRRAIRLLKPNIIKRTRAYFLFGNSTIKLGRNVRVNGTARVIKTGQNINIYDDCIFHFGHEGVFEMGSHIIFSYHCLVECTQMVRIGNNVQIGEHTSIRDTTHDYRTEGTIKGSPDIAGPIDIGNNVWIGKGCLIAGDTVIEDGVVVAANSVVKGRLLRDKIYGGAPAKLIKSRFE